MFKQKLKAALLHLAISAFVISTFIILAFYIWYPSPYSDISGLGSLIKILVVVDLTLGPILTFIIFKKNKPSLKFDLSVIASVQLVALAYGIFTIYQGHPVYVVYAVDRFELVPAQDVIPKNAKYEEFKVSTLWFPKLAYAKSPEDREERNTLLFESLSGKPDLERRPEYYEPIEKYTDVILKRGIEPNLLFSTADKRNKLQAFLDLHNKKQEDFAYLPLVGKHKDIVIAVNRKTGKITGTIDVYPWVKG